MLKKLFVVVALLVAFASPSFATPISVGDTVKLVDYYNSNSGGAFQIFRQPDDGIADVLSFCVEQSEYINFTDTFTVASISNRATKDNDPISAATAGLYLRWLNGEFGSRESITLNNDVQHALWYLENETGGVNNIFAQNAVKDFGTADYTGDRVRVLNLTFANGTKAQDQLIVYPVPEPGSMSLLGIGLLALGNRIRKWGTVR